MNENMMSADALANMLIQSLRVNMTITGVNDEYTVSGSTGILMFDAYIMVKGLKAVMEDYHKQFKSDEDCRTFLKSIIDTMFVWEDGQEISD